MIEALHVGSLGLAAVGACCTAAARGHRKTIGLSTAALMLTAMADAMHHILQVPILGWALILLVAAMAAGILQRKPARGSTEGSDRMPLHRNVGLILMAALLVIMDGHSTGSASGHAAHGGTDSLGIVLTGGSTLYLAASVWVAAGPTKVGVFHRIESVAMGLSILAMAVVWIL